MSLRDVLNSGLWVSSSNDCADQSFLRDDSYTRLNRGRASSLISVAPCRFYGRAFHRNRTHTHCGCVRESHGETERRGKKSHRYPSPLDYLRSFSPFTERRSASAGPIFRRPHLSRLVAEKIRWWPATSRRVAPRKSKINRRNVNESRGLSANIASVLTTDRRGSTTTVI